MRQLLGNEKRNDAPDLLLPKDWLLNIHIHGGLTVTPSTRLDSTTLVLRWACTEQSSANYTNKEIDNSRLLCDCHDSQRRIGRVCGP